MTRYDGMPHGFFTMIGVLDVSGQAVAHAAQRLSAAFSGPG